MGNCSDTIQWADKTVSPIMGCSRNCPGCFAKSMVARLGGRKEYKLKNWNSPRFFRKFLDGLDTTVPTRIFVCALGDIMSEKVKKSWILKIIDRMKRNSHNTYYVLSRDPGRFGKFVWPGNVILGTSVSSQKEVINIRMLLKSNLYNAKLVSFEPLREMVVPGNLKGIKMIFIGRMNGPTKNKYPVKDSWISILKRAARKAGSGVFLMKSLTDGKNGKWIANNTKKEVKRMYTTGAFKGTPVITLSSTDSSRKLILGPVKARLVVSNFLAIKRFSESHELKLTSKKRTERKSVDTLKIKAIKEILKGRTSHQIASKLGLGVMQVAGIKAGMSRSKKR